MEHTRGRILSIQPDPAIAIVEVDTVSFCARCAAGKGCGAGLFGSDRGPRHFEAPIVGLMDLREGDEVRIELAPRNVLHAALVVYGLPLTGLLLMVGIAYLFGWSDWIAVLAAGTGIVLGAFIGRRHLARSNCLRQFTPLITQRLSGAE
ncbi:MAG: SoxR reducing system RseC family protein [Gammaproteobacteria bacterium]|nr:SoxR reducing system RseC family protein [Gammaproteobacteria bacterium]